MKKRLIILTISCLMTVGFFASAYSYDSNNSTGVEYVGFEATDKLEEDHAFTTTNEDGSITEMDIDTLEDLTKQQIAEKEAVPYGIGGTVNFTNGVVNFKTKPSADYNTNYTEDITNRAGYLNGYYGTDGAFLGYNSDGSKVKFIQAGVVGWVASNEVEILNYDDNNVVKSVNFYNVRNGKLYHNGTNDLRSVNYSMTNMVGYKQDYMNEGAVYYSYDGHYFYGAYATMISDYKNNIRSNSINSNNPYYNYYQFLSHRSKTNITGEMLNNFVNSMTSKATSKMKGMGQYFIDYQNIYGSNALLMFGVSANESAWGNSAIAQSKNNLFGHAAYDGTAGDTATGYFSPQLSIYSHAKYFISEGYLDPLDYSDRYYGAHLGDKSSGMNVKYASDPYWGEKAAEIAWLVQDANPSVQDANKYTLGIKENGSALNIRSEATNNSSNLYSSKATYNYPFIILGEANGESVSGNAKWYKIQSDSTLNSNRSAITRDKGEYDFNNYYAYVSSAYVNIVGKGNGSSTPPQPSVVRGDVNGNGRVDAADYLMIMDNILGKFTMNAQQKTAGDVNSNGRIDAADYLMVMDCILGKITLN